jgi:16S rRNA (cytosine967-C5)-methyltransferase
MRSRQRRIPRGTIAGRPPAARDVAFAVLSEYKNSGRFVSQLLDRTLASSPDFSPDERRLAVELINGVVRREATLDALLAPHVARPRHRIEGELWTLLQLGAYQLVFMDAIPQYAAVNETVALAKQFGRKGWDGFVNGVLRALQPLLTDQFAAKPAADALPITDGRYRRLTRGLFRDPSRDPVAYAAEAFSFPRWLIERWLHRFDLGELCRIGFWFNEPAALALRVNLLKADRDAFLQILATHGVRAAPGRLPESICMEGTRRVDSLPGFTEGLFSVQDDSAMQAVDLLSPRAGETVLDLCAAPGSKTTHIAERMRNTGTVIATDIRSDRLRRVDENCRRLGISTVRALLVSPAGDNVPPGPFDAVLVDVPCSNTGVLGKRPEARWRIDEAQIAELVRQQEALLMAACKRLKPGGRVVYSTCSIEPEENEQIVRHILDARTDLMLVCERHHVPGRPADGGYQALLQRADSPCLQPSDGTI